jgi:hypothetical protein
MIYEEGGGRASKDLLSRITGNTSSSSSFTRKVNALKAYGLVSEESGEITLSQTGLTAVAPTEPALSREAKKTAFQQIDIFNRIYERHKGKILPADEFLKNIIEQDYGVPRELVGDWISSLKDALKVTGLLLDRGDGKLQIMVSPIVRFPRLDPTPTPLGTEVPAIKESTTSEAAPEPPSREALGGGHSTRIELSGKRFATFSIPDALTARDANKLKSALTGLSAIIDSMVQEELQ